MFRPILALLLTPCLCWGKFPDNAFATDDPPNGTVLGAAQQSDGGTVVVGEFTKAGSPSRLRIARYRIDGSLDPDFVPGSGANAAIRCVAVTEDDEILIGGEFTLYQGNPVDRLALLHPDGSFKDGFAPVGDSGSVEVVAVHQGTVYAGGTFAGHFRAFNKLGGWELSKPAGSPNAPVHAICLDPEPAGPYLTLGGEFTRFGTRDVGYLVHLDRNLRPLSAANQHPGADGPVRALDILPGRYGADPTLIVAAGDFTHFNGENRDRLAAIYGPDPGFASPLPGSLSGGLGSYTTFPRIQGTIDDVAFLADQSLAVAGEFSVNPATTNLVFGSRSGLQLTAIESQHQPNGRVHALSPQRDGMLVLGGEFTTVDGLARPRLARLYHAFGASDPPAAVTNRSVYPMDESKIHVDWIPPSSAFGTGIDHLRVERRPVSGSEWETITVVPPDVIRHLDEGLPAQTGYAYRITSVSGTGTTSSNVFSTYTKEPPVGGTADLAFDATGAGVGLLRRIAVDPAGRVLAAESTGINSEPGEIVRVLPDGTRDESFAATIYGSFVHALEVLADGRVLVAGDFAEVNGEPRPFLARLNDDGSTDTRFVATANGPVRHLLELDDGSLLVGGTFSEFNGVPVAPVVRLDRSGALHPAFAPGDLGATSVTGLARAPDGSAFVVTSATEEGDALPRCRIRKIAADGTVDPAFAPPDGLFLHQMYDLRVDREGRLLTGCRMWPLPRPAGWEDSRIVRFLADGSPDPDFGSEGVSDPFGQLDRIGIPLQDSVVPLSDGRIAVCGSFQLFAGRPRYGITFLRDNGGIDHFHPGGSGVSPWGIEQLVALADGRLAAGGTFQQVSGADRRFLAILHSGTEAEEPAAPAVAAAPADGGVLVSWDPVADATGYLVERSLGDGWVEVARLPFSTLRLLDRLPHGTEANYRVRSISGDFQSASSPAAGATATTAFGQWLEGFGLAADLDPEADLDHDFWPLVLEFALGRHPLEPERVAWHDLSTAGRLGVDAPRSSVRYAIESAGGLGPWQEETARVGGEGLRLELPFAPVAGESGFRRLRVTLLP